MTQPEREGERQPLDDLEKEESSHERGERERTEGDFADLTELAAPAPIDRGRTTRDSLEKEELKARKTTTRRDGNLDENAFLSEEAVPVPEERRPSSDDEGNPTDSDPTSVNSTDGHNTKDGASEAEGTRSDQATYLYTISHLIFFSLLGTLARLGVDTITLYSDAPVTSPVLWANLGGSLFMGFLAEDRRIFRQEWGNTGSKDWSFHPSKTSSPDESVRESTKSSHGKVKKTIPLFIGLATGFCGSFTSFSSFIRDAFLALTNDLPSPPPGLPYPSHPIVQRNGGYSFEATLAILIIHVAVSLGALHFGAHLALALDPYMPTIPFKFIRKFLDPLVVFLAFGCWLGAILLSIWPPATNWRGRATFSLVFAPTGCLLRFYASKHLNARIPSFPLGTFAVNIFGTIVLGMCFDLQHSGTIGATPRGSVTACQVLQGVMDGFCGCATTVSTWVLELNGLRRRHAYSYGLTSVSMALGFLVIIMGSLGWTKGFAKPVCQ